MKYLLLILALLLPSEVYATPSTCSFHSECADVCTAEFNPALPYGHCIDSTGQVSAAEAIESDLALLPTPGDYSVGVPYHLPPASELLLTDHDSSGSAILIDRKLILEGNGAVLYFDEQSGVAVDVYASLTSSSPHQSVLWSSLRDFTVRNRTNVENDTIGVRIRAHGVRASNLMLMGHGTCLDVKGEANEANANAGRIRDIVATGCYDYAVHVHGSDANAGLYSGVETLHRTGIRDSSFLGNTWISPHSEDNDKVSADWGDLVSFIVDGAANAATVIGLYIESGDADAYVEPLHALFVGGNGIRTLPYKVDRVGYGRSKLTFKLNDPRQGHDYRTTIPGPGTSGGAGAIQIQRSDETWGWRLKIGTSNHWGWHSESPFVPPAFSWRSYANWGLPSNDPGAGVGVLGPGIEINTDANGVTQ